MKKILILLALFFIVFGMYSCINFCIKNPPTQKEINDWRDKEIERIIYED